MMGGLCSNDVSMNGAFRRYFCDTVAEEVVNLLHLEAGHKIGNPSFYSLRLECLLGSEGMKSNLVYLIDGSNDVIDRTSTLEGVLDHLENLGHTAVPSVAGLNVDVPGFQRETLDWVLERESMPGGIQSLFWFNLSQGESTQKAFFNPILNRFRRDAPKVVHGGIINYCGGLDTTVLSLAIALQNPAPTSPPSGANRQNRRCGAKAISSKWDSDSCLESTKGTIISRGTLVVVRVFCLLRSARNSIMYNQAIVLRIL